MVCWQDNKPVILLSALPIQPTEVIRHSHTGVAITLPCPSILRLYNAAMGGTDSFDQRMSYYWPQIRSYKWTVRVLVHFFYVAVLNSHILFREKNRLRRDQTNFSFLSFIQTLTIQLTAVPSTKIRLPHRPRKANSADICPRRVVGTHTPCHVPLSKSAKTTLGCPRTLRKVCAVCKKDTAFMCAQCAVGLHINIRGQDNCWETYHSADFH